MAEKFLWDKQSNNPTPDVENPPIVADSIAEAISGDGNICRKGNSCLTSKAMKLGLSLAFVAGAVVLGVVLGLNSSSNEPLTTKPTAAISLNSISESGHDTNKNFMSVREEYYAVPDSDAKVNLALPSMINGYETCSDLEKDFTDALKIFFKDYIENEAVSNEIYAECDPNNDNWYWDQYQYDDDYFFHGYYSHDPSSTCNPADNVTTSCATDTNDKDVPWVLTWHELDHAEGVLFFNETEALEAYENVNASWAKRLYCPYKMVVQEYGWMPEKYWCQLETWAYEAQCTGDAPISTAKKAGIKEATKSLPRESRLTTANLEKKRKSRAPTDHFKRNIDDNDKSRSDKTSTLQDSVSQNSQNEDVNEKEKVVSDGTHIFSAYGDVLYAWLASDNTQVSITHMPGASSECDWNATEPCTSWDKPNVQALFLSANNRLTVLFSQGFWKYNMPVDQIQPILSDYDMKVVLQVYDISNVTLGSPLKLLGQKELSGDFVDGGSFGNKTIITTKSHIETYTLTRKLSRGEPEYCGLDTTSYIQLATDTANSQIKSFAKQMVSELNLINDCSRTFQISMQDVSSADGIHLSFSDLLRGSFVQVHSFDMSFTVGSDIPMTVVGSFTAGYDLSMYLTEDFLVLPSNIYRYNETSGEMTYESFILGFNLLSDNGAIPCCYGHIPGQMMYNHQMDKSGDHLRIFTSEYTDTNGDLNNISILQIPNDGSGTMSLIGESESLFGREGYFDYSSRFVGNYAYLSAPIHAWGMGDLVVVDLSDQQNPSKIGSLRIGAYLSYMEEIVINNVPYILGIGNLEDDSAWGSSILLLLIDISVPSTPKVVTSYQEVNSYTTVLYDFLEVRYTSDQKLIIPVLQEDYSGFTVYNISDTDITPALRVPHAADGPYYCNYNAWVPPRSFVFHSEFITTIHGHTSINTDMQTGNLISQLDLDVGLNYTSCEDDYYYYDYPEYFDEMEGHVD